MSQVWTQAKRTFQVRTCKVLTEKLDVRLEEIVWKRNQSLSPTHELWFMESTTRLTLAMIKIYDIQLSLIHI